MTVRSAARITRAGQTAPATVGELIARLGGIPPERIRMTPPPGTATEADLEAAGKPTCELVDGTLVEKAMGNAESFMGVRLASLIWTHVEATDLGVVLGEAGFIRLGRGQVRAPDVTFIPWENLPEGEIPAGAYWSVAPGLIVEVLSPTNTKPEIDRKLGEFFAAGCKLAWVVDPPTRTVKVYTSARRVKELDETGVLDGGRVLPGFTLPLADVFAPCARRKRKGR